MAKIISYSDHIDRNSSQSSNYLIGIILVVTGLLTLIFYIGLPILIIGVIILLSKSREGWFILEEISLNILKPAEKVVFTREHLATQ